MVNFMPVTLLGNSLGERHRHLNTLVNNVYKSSIPFETIRDLPEVTAVDRLFKIDLASKHKNVEYIINNLKDTDMLYVTRALKCTWLLNKKYKDIINANYLEKVMFPEMTTTAVNKIKHWLQNHLQDPDRCLEFYTKYKENEFNLAVKFLCRCSNEYILAEFTNIITKMEPQDLKIISEKTPELTKIFYERLEDDRDVTSHYLNNEEDFFNCLKFILKSDPDTFFDVTEKYFNKHRFRPLSPAITKYIMVNHKNRFLKKQELYTTQLLDMKTLVNYLNPGEVKELVLKLAKAEYLENWFTYQAVEPLIKRLDNKERVEFKRLIFVDKAFGDKIKEWPYTPPTSPILKRKPGYSLFLDRNHEYQEFSEAELHCMPMLSAKKLKCCKRMFHQETFLKRLPQQSLLDKLFDNYRFASFETTLIELRKQLRTESSPQNRQFMMLVLVSKSGGCETKLRSLFELLLQFKNEPVHWRAAIVRSLVKRAFVWRLPNDLWSTLLDWGHGLGLDGSPPEAACDEGLHAVVLRNLLADEVPNADVLKAFFNNFSDFTSYQLNTAENSVVRIRLPNLLLAAAKAESDKGKLQRLDQLLDTLSAYKIPFNNFREVISEIATAVQQKPEGSEFLLHRLYKARVARRQLFRENFLLLQNNTSYLNALRHDTSIIDFQKFTIIIEKEQRLPFDQFLKKLSIYFSESGGLAEQFYSVIKFQAENQPHKYLARPLAYLAGDDLALLLKKYDVGTWRSPITKKQRLAAELRANAHKSKPQLDLSVYDWKAAGPKAVANFVSVSPRCKQEEIINKLMRSRRTLRLALSLTKSGDTLSRLFVYKTFVALRPGAALKYFLGNLKKEQGGNSFIAIWEIVKPVIGELDYKNRKKLFDNLVRLDTVPDAIKAEYYVLIYQTYVKNKNEGAPFLLCHIENLCYDMDEEFINETIKSFLKNDFVAEKNLLYDYNHYNIVKCTAHARIIAKFLLLCRSEQSQKQRLNDIGDPFFSYIEDLWKDPKKIDCLVLLISDFLITLKYNKVFFDTKYVSCMPVFERVVSWMHRILPIEKWFHLYTNIHLTMLYYKTVRYCVTEKPVFFNKDLKYVDKGIKMIGDIFGKFIAHECEQLKVNYFQSIREIYEKDLMNYLENYIDYRRYDESKEMFAIALIKSILTETEANEAHFVATLLFQDHKRYFAYDYDLNEIHYLLKEMENDELCLFLKLPSVVTNSVILFR